METFGKDAEELFVTVLLEVARSGCKQGGVQILILMGRLEHSPYSSGVRGLVGAEQGDHEGVELGPDVLVESFPLAHLHDGLPGPVIGRLGVEHEALSDHRYLLAA